MKIQLFRYILDQRVWRTHIRYTAFYHLYIKLWSLCTWGCKYLYVRYWYFTSYREFNWERYGEKAERWDIENAIHHTYTGINFIPFYIYKLQKHVNYTYMICTVYTHPFGIWVNKVFMFYFFLSFFSHFISVFLVHFQFGTDRKTIFHSPSLAMPHESGTFSIK